MAVFCVIDDAELPGGYAMDALLGMDNERMGVVHSRVAGWYSGV